MRSLRWVLLLVAPLLAQETGGAAGADLARFFPADTFAYAEADASALEACLPEWQIARIIGDPALKALFRPAFEKLGIDPEKPVESLLGKYPVKDVLDGRAAVGVRGMSVVVRDATLGKEWRFRVSPGAPLDGRAIYRLQSLMQSVAFGRKITWETDVDFLAVGRPGPLGRKLVEQALGEMEGEVTREAVKVAGLDATHIRVQAPIEGDLSYAFNLYAVERGGTWFLASVTDTLEQALSGGARASLAGSATLAQARARLTGGRPLLLAHVDLSLLLDAFRGLVFPIAQEMSDIAGMGSIRGVGLGVSLVDGGMRESLGVLLDGNPQGVWRLLDAMPAGLKSFESAPPGALIAAGMKLDPALLLERIRGYVAEVSPGSEDEFERDVAREIEPLDLAKDVLPALGDEAVVFVYPARMNDPLPGFVVRAEARDEEALARFVAKVQAQISPRDARFEPVSLPDGTKAVRVMAATPYDMHFAVHKGHLLLASNPRLLGEAMAWGTEGKQSLARDDPMLPLVLKATGGDAGNVAALAYVNLRGCGIEALRSVMMWGQLIPPEWLDPTQVGELRRIPNHLTGAAIAFRHDKDAVVLDCFSPVGVFYPAVLAAIFSAPRQMEVQVVLPRGGGTGRASLGINQKSWDGESVKVLGLVANGPAAAAGFRQGDRITGIGGVAITSIEDLKRELAAKKPGESVEVKIRRGDTELTLTVELGEEEEAGS